MKRNRSAAVSSQQSAENSDYKLQDSAFASQRPQSVSRQNIKREEIAAIVDNFLKTKISASPEITEQKPETAERKPLEAKTIIHQITNREKTNSNGGQPKESVDFVSEDDVKQALDKGEKIFITAKTIITPSARDLGDEREIFAEV